MTTQDFELNPMDMQPTIPEGVDLQAMPADTDSLQPTGAAPQDGQPVDSDVEGQASAAEDTPAPKSKRTRRSAKADDQPADIEGQPDLQDEPHSVEAEAENKDAENHAGQGEGEAVTLASPGTGDQLGIDPETGLRLRPVRRRSDAVTLDSQTQYSAAQADNDLLDLTEAWRTRTFMTATIQGVECIDGTDIPQFAILYHGAYKIIIPVEELVQVDADASNAYRSAAVERRLGAEIDFIVKGIDQENRLAAASRVEAMEIKRRSFYIRKDVEGNTLIHEGCNAEARVVCVLSYGVFVELFGVETFIPRAELSLVRINDANEMFKVGQTVLVRVLQIQHGENGDIEIRVSIRQANSEYEEMLLQRFVPGNLYAGIVTLVNTTGIFVDLGNAACLCPFPRRGRPAVGTRVCIRIRGVNMENKHIWGVIIR